MFPSPNHEGSGGGALEPEAIPSPAVCSRPQRIFTLHFGTGLRQGPGCWDRRIGRGPLTLALTFGRLQILRLGSELRTQEPAQCIPFMHGVVWGV